MSDQNQKNQSDSKLQINSGYADFQLAKALRTSRDHSDEETRERAGIKASKWFQVLKNFAKGSVEYGSRQPIKDMPVWATPEVITGGFVTGNYLAGGPLLDHEKTLLEKIKENYFPDVNNIDERLALNSWYLTEEGLSELTQMLEKTCYEINVPEEGALLTIAWLAKNKHIRESLKLIEIIKPFFSKLRFYPAPVETPSGDNQNVFVQSVGETIGNLSLIGPKHQILAQKETINIWIPIHDKIVSLFLETYENGWPCRNYPDGWNKRVREVIGDYNRLIKKHKLCKRIHNQKGHKGQLRILLEKCIDCPEELTGRDVGQIRNIIAKYTEKRGTPGSEVWKKSRQNQSDQVRFPTYQNLARVVISRLNEYNKNDGIEDVSPVFMKIKKNEVLNADVPEGSEIPESIRKKVLRSLSATVDHLIEKGIIKSGEVLAEILPRITSNIRSLSISDNELKKVYSSVYRAFRKRRSLLLLDLASQVRLEEIPWIKTIETFKTRTLSDKEVSLKVLREISKILLTSFPHVIVPNKLLQEFESLKKAAELDFPIVNELAADIFMGRFSDKYPEAVKDAEKVLAGSLYERYYNIDYESINKKNFAKICKLRTGVSEGFFSTADNGKIIEQQQILTTQNLAALFHNLDLKKEVDGELPLMAEKCFEWILKKQLIKTDSYHTKLLIRKNTAYAWRQMVFYLSLMDSDRTAFLTKAETQIAGNNNFQKIQQYLKGLKIANKGDFLNPEICKENEVEVFLGWQ